MGELRWLAAAERAAFQLPAGARRELITILGHIRENPELFRMVDRGRYRGRRRALIAGRWHLYYRVIGPERTDYLDAIRDARRRPV